MHNHKRVRLVFRKSQSSRIEISAAYGLWRFKTQSPQGDSIFDPEHRKMIWQEQIGKFQKIIDVFPDALVIGREVNQTSAENSEIVFSENKDRTHEYFLKTITLYKRRLAKMEEEVSSMQRSIYAGHQKRFLYDEIQRLIEFVSNKKAAEEADLGIVTGSFGPNQYKPTTISRAIDALGYLHQKLNLVVSYLEQGSKITYRNIGAIRYKHMEIETLRKRTERIEGIYEKLEQKNIALLLFPYLSSEIPRFAGIVRKRMSAKAHLEYSFYDPSPDRVSNIAHLTKEIGLGDQIAIGTRMFNRQYKIAGYEGVGLVSFSQI